jgi:trans-aconitate methyltransferase
MSDQAFPKTKQSSDDQWNAALYESKHGFVSHLGTNLISLLSPHPNERVLDLGCGTGHLTQQIAEYGADVIGVDSSPSMLDLARKNYSNLRFELGDATQLKYASYFDAVFSNAVLHWVTDQERATASIAEVLKTGGRFVAEFGGKGNVKTIATAIYNALESASYPFDKPSPWFYPSIGEYASLLERFGLEVTFATMFDRPTSLEEGDRGLQNWLQMFAQPFFEALPPEKVPEVVAHVEDQLRPHLYQEEVWYADYRRIRVVAVKV